MLKSEKPAAQDKNNFSASVASRGGTRARLSIALLFVLALVVTALAIPAATAQDFSLTAGPLTEKAVAPGGTSASNVTLTTNSGFVGPVTFSCTVTPIGVSGTVSNPVCTVSPASLAEAGGASATITTTDTTTNVSYSIVVSGTDASGTVSAQPLTLTVLAVTPVFTLSVVDPVAPSSVPAASSAEGTIVVNPINGYTTPTTCTQSTTAANCGITLYCASISPLELYSPYCSFTYPNGFPSLVVGGGQSSQPVTVTINTFGPVITGSKSSRRILYALWCGIPLFGLVAMICSDNRKRKIWGITSIFLLIAALTLTPACSNTSTQTTTNNGVTPAATYTFTIVGVDGNGVASSNTGSSTTTPSVTLTVTAPTT